MTLRKPRSKNLLVYLFSIVFFLSITKLHAQWYKQNMTWEKDFWPTLRFNDVCFLDDEKGFVIGPAGLLIASGDGGHTWDFIDLQTAHDLYSVTFSSDETVWIAGNNRLYRSPDRGQTWEGISLFEIYDLKDVFFLDQTHGWVAANDMVFATNDSGNSWEQINQSVFGSQINKIGFSSLSFGWAVTGDGKLWLTADGGIQWGVSPISDGFVCNSAQFLNPNLGWACGLEWPGGITYITTNGGISWDVDLYNSEVYDLTVIDPDKYIFIGWNGLVYYKTAEPNNFAQLPYSGFQCNWNSISRSRTGEFWITSVYGGSVMHSTDGIDWDFHITRLDQNWGSVFFIDENTGWASAYDELWKTVDGGRHWFLAWYKEYFDMHNVLFIDENHGWVAGNRGRIFYTNDGGFTWYPRYDDGTFPGLLVSIQFVDQSFGWAANQDERKILYTVNGGNHWEYLDVTFSNYINDLHFSDRNNGWVVSDFGLIFHTPDGGNTWSQQNGLTVADLNSVYFLDSLHGYTAGNSGKIQYTGDGGVTWVVRNSHTQESLNDIYFRDFMNGWACGGNGTITHTTDGGVSWSVEQGPTEETLNSIYSVDHNKAWAVGEYGVILHADYSGSQYIQEYVNKPEFSATIHPNPCHDKAIIEYLNHLHDQLTLEVYDLSGKLCYTDQRSGSSDSAGQFRISMERWNRGIYVARLINGRSNLSLKIIRME